MNAELGSEPKGGVSGKMGVHTRRRGTISTRKSRGVVPSKKRRLGPVVSVLFLESRNGRRASQIVKKLGVPGLLEFKPPLSERRKS